MARTTRTISVRLPEPVSMALDDRARASGSSLTSIALSALEEYLGLNEWEQLQLNPCTRCNGSGSEPAESLTAAEREAAVKAFKEGKGCIHCGGLHLRYCPRVRTIKFHGNEPAEVSYWREGQFTWPDEIIFPDEVQ